MSRSRFEEPCLGIASIMLLVALTPEVCNAVLATLCIWAKPEVLHIFLKFVYHMKQLCAAPVPEAGQ